MFIIQLSVIVFACYVVGKLMEQANDFTQSSLVSDRTIAVLAQRSGNDFQTFELAMMFLLLQCIKHLGYKVINIKQFQFYRRIVYLNWQIVGDVVAECCNS